MQISIDTTKDSHADIRKAIALLQSIVSDAPVRTNAPNIFDNPVPGESASPAPAAPNLFSMFDSASGAQGSTPAATPSPEKKSDDQIELY